MVIIQASTVAWLTVNFKDKDGNATIPASASYKVYCMTTNTLIRDTTALTPASSIEIELAATDTAIQGTGKEETRKVCVTSVYGVDDSRIDNYRFKIRAALPCVEEGD